MCGNLTKILCSKCKAKWLQWILFHVLLLSSSIWWKCSVSGNTDQPLNYLLLAVEKSTLSSFPCLVDAFKGNYILSILIPFNTIQGTVIVHKCNGRPVLKSRKCALYNPWSSAFFYSFTVQTTFSQHLWPECY